MSTKQYLGDSVYVEFNGFDLTLTTENGSSLDPSNRIVLEVSAFRNLEEYVKRMVNSTKREEY